VDDIKCPSCKSECFRCLGNIPASDIFAGRQLGYSLPGGKLWRCSSCNLVFRYPRISKEILDQLYRQGNVDNWDSTFFNRSDWGFVENIIANTPTVKSILYVGCFDGRLLNYLPEHIEKLGVEIHGDAARKAMSNGIRIIAKDFEELDTLFSVADAVLALDVIEHTDDPLRFLFRLSQVTKKNGLIIIGSGNSDCPSWRFMGSKYWYCHIAEHISFINPEWVIKSAKSLGLEILVLNKFSHGNQDSSFSVRSCQFLSNLIYRLFPRLFSWLRWILGKNSSRNIPPNWMSARDHMLVVLKKSA